MLDEAFGDVSDNGRDNDSQSSTGDSQSEVEIDPKDYLLE